MSSRCWPAVVAVAALLTACGIPARERSSWREPPGQMFDTGPYIILGGEGEAFIALTATLTGAPQVEWWVEASPDTPARRGVVVATKTEDLWTARLLGLPVGPRINYRVRSSKGITIAHSFQVGVPRGTPFRFAAFGDTRTRHSVHRAVINGMSQEKLAFVLHTGDMVARGGIQKQWDRFFRIERPLLVKTPLLPSIGNHDKGRRDYYRHYFMHKRWAHGLRYYFHDWGNLRILAVDGGIECRDGCDQYAFARKALADGVRKNMLMVIMLHFPPYSSGSHGSDMRVQKPITDLAREYGVELVIAGHDHNYERTKPINGTTYVVSGSAGAPIRPVRPRWFTAEARTEPHYVLVDVENDRMILRSVNLRGDTFDTAVIQANPPQVKLGPK